MKTRHKILLLGMLLYIASFFLPAAVVYVYGTKYLSGAECAYFTLQWSLHEFNDVLHHRVVPPPDPASYLLPLISGLINPVFLIGVIPLMVNPHGKLSTIIRIVLLFMLAITLYSFYLRDSDVRPAVGYFLWNGAMLLVLFADRLEKLGTRRGPATRGRVD